MSLLDFLRDFATGSVDYVAAILSAVLVGGFAFALLMADESEP